MNDPEQAPLYPSLTEANKAAAAALDRLHAAGDGSVRSLLLMLVSLRRVYGALRSGLHLALAAVDAPVGAEEFAVLWTSLTAKNPADPRETEAALRHGVLPWLLEWARRDHPGRPPELYDVAAVWPGAPRPLFGGELVVFVGAAAELDGVRDRLQSTAAPLQLIEDFPGQSPPRYPGEPAAQRAGRVAAAVADFPPQTGRPPYAALVEGDPTDLDATGWEQARQFAWLVGVGPRGMCPAH